MRGLAVIVLALAFAAPSAASTDPQVKILKRQVATLTVQVKQLQSTVARLELQTTQTRQLAICYYALGQDSFKIAFNALSSVTEYITGKRVASWDAIQRYDDKGACSAAGIERR